MWKVQWVIYIYTLIFTETVDKQLTVRILGSLSYPHHLLSPPTFWMWFAAYVLDILDETGHNRLSFGSSAPGIAWPSAPHCRHQLLSK
jgi:hypothetical protein